MRLSDTIEKFIKNMLEQDEQEIELKRNELAEYFHCAPSQINYVLSTRFTPNHGYVIQSQRGGGGYIRIYRMKQNSETDLLQSILSQINDTLPAIESVQIISQLHERGAITLKEKEVMKAALCTQAFSLPLPQEIKDALRAKMLKQMLCALVRNA